MQGPEGNSAILTTNGKSDQGDPHDLAVGDSRSLNSQNMNNDIGFSSLANRVELGVIILQTQDVNQVST